MKNVVCQLIYVSLEGCLPFYDDVLFYFLSCKFVVNTAINILGPVFNKSRFMTLFCIMKKISLSSHQYYHFAHVRSKKPCTRIWKVPAAQNGEGNSRKVSKIHFAQFQIWIQCPGLFQQWHCTFANILANSNLSKSNSMRSTLSTYFAHRVHCRQ